MKSVDRHIVRSQGFEITSDERANAELFFRKIKTLFYERLSDKMAVIFEKYTPADRLLAFEHIELDLGTVNSNNFEQEIEWKLEEELTAFFQNTFAPDGELKRGKWISKIGKEIELIRTFLTSGHINWGNNQFKKPIELLLNLIKDKPAQVKKLILEIGKQEKVRKRIAFQFDDQTINKLIHITRPDVGKEIIQYKLEVEHDQRRNNRIDIGPSNYKQALWEIVLAYLFYENKSYYSRKNFLLYYFKRVAANYNLDYFDLLDAFDFAASSLPEELKQDVDFSKIIKDLVREELGFSKDAILDRSLSKNNSVELLIDFVLTNGFFHPRATIQSFGKLNEKLNNEFLEPTELLQVYFDKIIRDKSKKNRLLRFLSNKNLNHIAEFSRDISVIENVKTLKRLLDQIRENESFKYSIYPQIKSFYGRLALGSIDEKNIVETLIIHLQNSPSISYAQFYDFIGLIKERVDIKVKSKIKKIEKDKGLVLGNSATQIEINNIDFEQWIDDLISQLKTASDKAEKTSLALEKVTLLIQKNQFEIEHLKDILSDLLRPFDLSLNDIDQIVFTAKYKTSLARINDQFIDLNQKNIYQKTIHRFYAKIESNENESNDQEKLESETFRFKQLLNEEDKSGIFGFKRYLLKHASIFTFFNELVTESTQFVEAPLLDLDFFQFIENLFNRAKELKTGKKQIQSFLKQEIHLLKNKFDSVSPSFLKHFEQRVHQFILMQHGLEIIQLKPQKTPVQLNKLKQQSKLFLSGISLTPDNFDSASFKAELTEKVLLLSAKESTNQTALIQQIYLENLENYNFKQVLVDYPLSIQKIIRAKLKIIIECSKKFKNFEESQLKTIAQKINELKSDLPALGQYEINQLVNASVKHIAASFLMEKFAEIIVDFDLNDLKEENEIEEKPKKIQIQIIEHWLIKLEHQFKTWKHLNQFSRQIYNAIEIFAANYNVAASQIKKHVIDVLSARNELNPFEERIMNTLTEQMEESKKRINLENELSRFSNKLLSHYFEYNELPDWLEDHSMQYIAKILKNAAENELDFLIRLLRNSNQKSTIYEKDNYEQLIIALDEKPLKRFYSNFIEIENFMQDTLKKLFVFSKNVLQEIRRRILIFGFETSFKSDNETFYKRFVFVTSKLLKVTEETIQQLLYFRINSLEVTTKTLIFWQGKFESKIELSEKITDDLSSVRHIEKIVHLLFENTVFNAHQKQIFETLVNTSDLYLLGKSEAFKKAILNRLTRERVLEHANDFHLHEMITQQLTQTGKLQFNALTKRIELLSGELTEKEFKTLQFDFFNRLLQLFAVGKLRSMNREEWISVLYTLIYDQVGVNEFDKMIHENKKLDLFIQDEINLEQKLTVIKAEKFDIQLKTSEKQGKVENDDSKQEMTKEGVYINNAGLVILSPFFSRYFERIGLTKNGKFGTVEDQMKAANLLQYLVDGKEETDENDLMLNKLFCGLNLNTPIQTIKEVSEAEKQIGESLLQAIIQQWVALKNTSIKGLRESFLIREGKLIEEEESYRLIVSPKSFDMLLDQLPWSIGRIKLSWMKKIIIVEWK